MPFLTVMWPHTLHSGASPENLPSIAGGANLSEVALNLVRWAEAQDRVEDLVSGAREENPGNGKQTFTIKAEKVPNSAGIKRVIESLGGPSATLAADRPLDRMDWGRSGYARVKRRGTRPTAGRSR